MDNTFTNAMADDMQNMTETALKIYTAMRKDGLDKKTALISTRATMVAQVSMVNQLLEDLINLKEALNETT